VPRLLQYVFGKGPQIAVVRDYWSHFNERHWCRVSVRQYLFHIVGALGFGTKGGVVLIGSILKGVVV
jgi:hypothetical protein